MHVTLLAVATLFFGCSSRGVYDSLQQPEALKIPPASGQPATRKPSYDEYEKDRRVAERRDMELRKQPGRLPAIEIVRG